MDARVYFKVKSDQRWHMRPIVLSVSIRFFLALALAVGAVGCRDASARALVASDATQGAAPADRGKPDAVVRAAAAMVDEGRRSFRFDTFGDEVFWTGVLRMNEPLSQVSPRTALAVGLKVDVDALPQSVVDALKAGQVNLDDPAVTASLLQ